MKQNNVLSWILVIFGISLIGLGFKVIDRRNMNV